MAQIRFSTIVGRGLCAPPSFKPLLLAGHGDPAKYQMRECLIGIHTVDFLISCFLDFLIWYLALIHGTKPYSTNSAIHHYFRHSAKNFIHPHIATPLTTWIVCGIIPIFRCFVNRVNSIVGLFIVTFRIIDTFIVFC